MLAPTRELASQIVDEAREAAAARNLSVARRLRRRRNRAARAPAGGIDIVVATPGRLIDLMKRKAIGLGRVEIVVLDEADRMLDMGFVRDIGALRRARRASEPLFLRHARRRARRPARQPAQRAAPHAQAASRRRRSSTACQGPPRGKLARWSISGERDLALVFVRTKRGADRLVKRMRARGSSRGDPRQQDAEPARARARRFRALGRRRLIATDVAARGIDVADVSHVINFDAPEDQDGYVHRTGRTGRAGRDGVAVTFVLGDQAREMGAIATRLGLEFPVHTGAANGHAPARRQGQGRQRNNRRSR